MPASPPVIVIGLPAFLALLAQWYHVFHHVASFSFIIPKEKQSVIELEVHYIFVTKQTHILHSLFFHRKMTAIVPLCVKGGPMTLIPFPTIDLPATGKNIQRLRQAKGYSIRDLQHYFGFQEPQAIYKWQRGECLPSVDNLFALSVLLEVSVNDILIPTVKKQRNTKPQAPACGFGFIMSQNSFLIWSIYSSLLSEIAVSTTTTASSPRIRAFNNSISIVPPYFPLRRCSNKVQYP